MQELLDQLRVVLDKQQARISKLVGMCNELEHENDVLRIKLENEELPVITNYNRSRYHDNSRAQREFDCLDDF